MTRALSWLLFGVLALSPRVASADEPAPPDDDAAAPEEPTEEALPEPEPPPPPAPPRKRPAVIGSFDISYGHQAFYDTPIQSVGFSAFVGEERPEGFDGGAIVEVMPGVTREHLHTLTLGIGPLMEARIGHLRLGGGLRLGAFSVTRVSTTGLLYSLTAGVFARASFDLVQFDRGNHQGALYVTAKAGVDVIPVDNALVGVSVWTASVGGGVRF
jgi:hypothetical protein